MRKRVNHFFEFTCSAPNCGVHCRTRETNDKRAWDIARKEGWGMLRRGAVVFHFCSWICRNAFERALAGHDASD